MAEGSNEERSLTVPSASPFLFAQEEKTVAFEIDSLSGDVLSQAPLLFHGRASEVVSFVVDELVGKSLAVLDTDSKVSRASPPRFQPR